MPDTADRPTRLIPARGLTPGTVVLRDCLGDGHCLVPSDRHGGRHELTVVGEPLPNGSKVEVLTRTESGDQMVLDIWSQEVEVCVPVMDRDRPAGSYVTLHTADPAQGAPPVGVLGQPIPGPDVTSLGVSDTPDGPFRRIPITWAAAAAGKRVISGVSVGLTPEELRELGYEDEDRRRASTPEQQARDMLDRMGVPDARGYTSGDLVELANLIAGVKPSVSKPPPDPDRQCVVWSSRFSGTYYHLYDDEEEAAGVAAAISDDGSASILGVQFADGRAVPVDEWAAYREAQDRRDREDADRLAAENARPRVPLMVARCPFGARSAPVWLDKDAEWFLRIKTRRDNRG